MVIDPIFFLVSPELSSGRDLVIQMSVRSAPSAIHGFLSRAYLGNRKTYLDDSWYVGGATILAIKAGTLDTPHSPKSML